MSGLLESLDSHVVSAQLLSWAWQAIWCGTLLAGLTGLTIRTLRRRISPAVHSLLWSVVLVKFLIPVGLSLPHLPGEYDDRTIGSAQAPVLNTDSAAPGLTPHALLRATSFPEWKTRFGDTARAHGWALLLAAAYVIAVLVRLIVRAWQYNAFYARCRSLRPADQTTTQLVADICHRLGVKRIPAARISDDPPAPFVMGLFRPVLVLTRHQFVRPDELETVIIHEIAHLRRGDLLVRLLQRTAGTLLFFWPVVSWVNRRIDQAREHACDAWALRHGRLTAVQYAHCLLQAARPPGEGGPIRHPASMAANPSTIERRIDVILETPRRLATHWQWSLSTLATSLILSVFAFSGGTPASGRPTDEAPSATKDAVKEHAIELYNRVATREPADFSGDGVLSYVEKDTYLIALAMRNAEAFMEEFPYVDRNHSERLDILEVYGAIRGITLIAYADRRPTAGPNSPLDFEFYHEALDVQSWLLDNAADEPTVGELDNIWSIVKRVHNPRGGTARMLDHGLPAQHVKTRPAKDLRRFKELENNITTVKGKLAGETDPKTIAKYEEMLDKLETLLEKLQET